MENTTQSECQMENITQGKAECYICHKTLTEHYIFHTKEVAVRDGTIQGTGVLIHDAKSSTSKSFLYGNT